MVLSPKNAGFTFIELAIVLAIIGLIIGGISVGRWTLRNSQLQSVVNDIDRYKQAVQLFKAKYMYLPGDMPTATTFWGVDTGCTVSPLSDATAANANPKTATCNGNGDGFIGDSTGTVLGGAANGHESFRMWQHLANANFIDNSYTGAWSSRMNQEDAGMNTPASKILGNSYLLFYVQPPASASIPAGEFSARYNHVIVYGATGGAANATYPGPIPPYFPGLTGPEAMGIDQKIDDGYPGTGNVLTYTNATNALIGTGGAANYTLNCANGTNPSTAAYITTGTSNICSLIFITGF